MYERNDKRRLYWLIDQYLLGKINDSDFCNEFHDSFVNEIDSKVFADVEYDILYDLSDASQRFSQYEEDFKLWQGFITSSELRQKIIETKEKLKEHSP